MARSGKKLDCLKSYAFLLPNLTGFACFTFLPVLASLALAFCQWDIVTSPRPAGVSNFVRMFGDADFWKFLGNTLFLMMSIPLGMLLSLGLAVLLNRKLRGTVFFRSVFFLPSVCAGVAMLMLWSWLYSPEVGLINLVIRKLTGLDGPAWLLHTAWAKPALILMGLWTGMGGRNMLLYLAALQSVDPELYEAAEIDGAGGWGKFLNITWPMLSPATFFIFIMSVINGFQMGFQQAYVMTQGGPAGATTTLSYYIFTEAFVELNMGYASAVAWFLFLLVLVVTAINWKYGGKLVHY